MATFPPLRPLPDRVTIALARLRKARYDGSASAIYVAQRTFDGLLDQLPRTTHQPMGVTDEHAVNR